MLKLSFTKLNTVLCLGAHADDIEIGCGGTILRLVREHPDLNFAWVVFSAKGRRRREAGASARALLKGAGEQKVMIKNFRDGFFPFQGELIKEFFETLKERIKPDLIFTHFREDRHQDHRVVSDFTWNTFRDHVILEYEIPKYDGDLQQPNLFVPLDQDIGRDKVKRICHFFQTQRNKHWFSEDTFLSLMRIRSVECASPAKYAEAFYCRKLIL